MRRRVGVAVAWVLATVAGVLIASAAVGSVRGRVTDEPTSPFVAAATTTVGSETIGTGGTTNPGTGGTTAPNTTATTRPPEGTATSSTTRAPQGTPPSSTTSTTSAPATTTTAAPQGELQSYQVVGGTISFSVFADHLTLLGVVPRPGFTVHDQDAEPTEIEVEFRSADHRSKAVVELVDGSVVTSSEEESGDD